MFDELGRLVSKSSGPPIKPSRNLTLELLRSHETQQRPDQDLGHHDQQLIQGLKIATQIRPDDREGATTEVIGNGYIPHSREVLSTRRRGRGLPRRGSPGRNVREVSTGLHPPAA